MLKNKNYNILNASNELIDRNKTHSASKGPLNKNMIKTIISSMHPMNISV